MIKKGTILQIRDSRKGNYVGIAFEDFDPELNEWYPIVVHQEEKVNGISAGAFWEKGEEIPARRGQCKLEILKEETSNE